MSQTSVVTAPAPAAAPAGRRRVEQHIVEIVSDSGEGAQKAGQSFGTVCAKMGNGVWTVEIIPAEIKPPARSAAGASGIRIRFGARAMTNGGDEADLVVAFNEQVLYGRIAQHAYRSGTLVLLESKWAEDPQDEIRAQYAAAREELDAHGLRVIELPLEKACQEVLPGTRLGKNMFVLGLLCEVYGRDLDKALDEVRFLFRRKGEELVEVNQKLVRAGVEYARAHLDLAFEVPPIELAGPMVVMNGNQASGLGIMAAGMEVVAMYPITPATSVSHYLSAAFSKVGGVVHQAEDEIAAAGFAIGASYAGKTACTITSGPGLALKTELLGLAVMAEVPLVVLVVQRGGPSTGLPTKIEQGDLLAALHASPGDAPKVILAPATIEECFHFMILARKIAEDLRTLVIVLSDANLATGVQPFPRPRLREEWLSPPIPAAPWPAGVAPYDWDETTGLSPRPIPGQRGGEYVLTGLAHTRWSKVAYDPESNQKGAEMRSRKLAALGNTLRPPTVHGDPEGDLLVVGWGSTLGAIEEAVDRLRDEGRRVSSLHLRFLSPLEPGLRRIFSRFKQVMTVEVNYSDPPDAPLITPRNRRRPQLARILRERTLVDVGDTRIEHETRLDVGGWSEVPGQPLPPGKIEHELRRRLELVNGREAS
ncbi:MAG TPA: 2-oxoacid:acceptor oxidoreductase subunit alpha [Thermoanaerobaculia bacterium]|jgi:2-oxoglutarate ferredoxin oxidoreductase subunit alpha